MRGIGKIGVVPLHGFSVFTSGIYSTFVQANPDIALFIFQERKKRIVG